jgi:hypothetical protein
VSATEKHKNGFVRPVDFAIINATLDQQQKPFVYLEQD